MAAITQFPGGWYDFSNLRAGEPNIHKSDVADSIDYIFHKWHTIIHIFSLMKILSFTFDVRKRLLKYQSMTRKLLPGQISIQGGLPLLLDLGIMVSLIRTTNNMSALG